MFVDVAMHLCLTRWRPHADSPSARDTKTCRAMAFGRDESMRSIGQNRSETSAAVMR